MTKTAIFIPARLGSTRLPNKPLAMIGKKPMILHVYERAVAAGIGDVYVACSEKEVAEVITQAGGNAIMTDADLPSGSDRIFQAFTKAGKDYDIIVNLQGDLPLIAPETIAASTKPLKNDDAHIATLAAEITEDYERTDPNTVKVITSFAPGQSTNRALYFSRCSAPYGEGPLYHHIGIYAYRRAALEKFVSLPVSPLEKREKLEQLRALENHMRIDVALVDDVPIGVDTAEDLARVQEIFEKRH